MNKNILYFYGVLFVALLVSVLIYYQFNRDEIRAQESTFASPYEANVAIQKILKEVSSNVNQGIMSVKYLEEFDKTKNKIFKK